MPIDINAQTCELKFKSWTFGGRQVELHHLDRESDEMDTSAFVPSGSWDVVSGECVIFIAD